MKSRRVSRMLPLLVLLAGALVATGCGNDSKTDKNPGGGGGGGSGGIGGGGSGGIVPADCGNGHVDAGEACDDGNDVAKDGCENDCTVTVSDCGNGQTEFGEECDDGNEVNGDGCSDICKEERCGNGYVEEGEQCDDANTTSGDGCSSTCTVECARDNECNADLFEVCVKEGENIYGSCLPVGKECDTEANCKFQEPVKCNDTQGCICAPRDAEPAEKGVCWTRSQACESCNNDIECGSSAVFFDRPQKCVEFHYTGAGTPKVCMPVNKTGSCPAGMILGGEDVNGLDMTGFCIPQTKTCPVIKCTDDKDCKDPKFPVCDPARQVCIPGCYINWEQNRETIGCPPSKPACHALPERLDPILLNECETAPAYGYGKCGVACETDADCAHRGNGVDGEPYVCKQDGLVKRCRPAGCLDDMECPEPGGIYLGYCDPYRQTCEWSNCRLGTDPRAGCGVADPYIDCKSTHKCVEDEGQEEGYGVCVLKNCIDNGGAVLDCKIGQFCAGEPMISMMTGEDEGNPLPVPDDVPIGVCYDMNQPVWCNTACGAHGDCRGGGKPGRSPENPAYCVGTQAGNFCYFGCEYQAECPGRWPCSSASLTVKNILPTVGLKICQGNADCPTGTTCVEPKVDGAVFNNWGIFRDDAGNEYPQQPFKVCECTGNGSCGSSMVCNEGIGTIDPENPAAGPVARYCSTNRNEFCGPNGTVEYYGENYFDTNTATWSPVFHCGCGEGHTSTCPATGPAGSLMEGQPIRCGSSVTDRTKCVGGQICSQYFYTPDGGGDPVCGVPPDPPAP